MGVLLVPRMKVAASSEIEQGPHHNPLGPVVQPSRPDAENRLLGHAGQALVASYADREVPAGELTPS